MPPGVGRTTAFIGVDGTHPGTSVKRLRRPAVVLGILSSASRLWGPLRIVLRQPNLLSGFMSQDPVINAAIEQGNGGLPGYLQMLALPALLMSVVVTHANAYSSTVLDHSTRLWRRCALGAGLSPDAAQLAFYASSKGEPTEALAEAAG